jgi:hypothetical protein
MIENLDELAAQLGGWRSRPAPARSSDFIQPVVGAMTSTVSLPLAEL